MGLASPGRKGWGFFWNREEGQLLLADVVSSAMYRVRAELPRGGFAVTSHRTATDALAAARRIRDAGRNAFVEDRYTSLLEGSELAALIATEVARQPIERHRDQETAGV